MTTALVPALSGGTPLDDSVIFSTATDKKQIGLRIKKMRDACDLTQAALGALIGKTRVAVTQWENGDSSPQLDMYPVLAHILGTTKSYLAFGDTDGIDPTTVSIPLTTYNHGKSQPGADIALPKEFFVRLRLPASARVCAYVVPADNMYDGFKTGDILLVNEADTTIQGNGDVLLLADPAGAPSIVQVLNIPGSAMVQIKLYGQTMAIEKVRLQPLAKVIGSIKIGTP